MGFAEIHQDPGFLVACDGLPVGVEIAIQQIWQFAGTAAGGDHGWRSGGSIRNAECLDRHLGIERPLASRFHQFACKFLRPLDDGFGIDRHPGPMLRSDPRPATGPTRAGVDADFQAQAVGLAHRMLECFAPVVTHVGRVGHRVQIDQVCAARAFRFQFLQVLGDVGQGDPADPEHVDPRFRLVGWGDEGLRQIGFSPRHSEQGVKRQARQK